MSLHDILRGDVMPVSGIDVSIGRNSFDPPAPVVPVFDVHHRSTVFNSLNDSIDPPILSSLSGILSYNSKLTQLGLIAKGSGVQPIVIGAIIDGYIAGSDYAFGLGSYTPIAIDTLRVNANPNVYSLLASGIIQVKMSGVYDVIGRASYLNTGVAQRQSWPITLQKLSPLANETGFAVVLGTIAYTYDSNLIGGNNTALIRCILRLQAGDLLQLVTDGTGALGVPGFTVVADGCGFTIEKLE